MPDVHRNEFFNGNKGQIWIDGIPVLTCSKAKIVKKIKYEDIPAIEGGGNKRIPVGHTIEVNFAFKLSGKEIINLTSNDITLIAANSNINGTVTKRVKCDGLTFDEEVLLDFEKGKVGEIELAGQAETYDILQAQ